MAAVGLPPEVDPVALRTLLNQAGLAGNDLRVELVGGNTRLCSGGDTTCALVSL